LVINGNLVPSSANTASFGSSNIPWKEMFVGPGSLNIAGPSGPSGASGTIGTDLNGIVYTESGFATPFINVGPSINSNLDPGAIGGWVLGPTGTYGTEGYDLIAQQKTTGSAVPAGLTGPVYSLIRNPGATGPTGPAGTNGVSNGYVFFLDTVTAASPITNGTLIAIPNSDATTTITTPSTTNTNNYLTATFTSEAGSLNTTTIVGGLWDLNLYTRASSVNGASFYFAVYYVDSDGTSNPVLLATGSSANSELIAHTTTTLSSESVYVPTTTLPDTTKRIQIKLYTNFIGNNKTATYSFRNGTPSHLHTTLLANTATGPTGPAGDTGPTGPISLNYICQASLTTDQTITSNIDTRILFTDEYDPNNWWTSSNTFNPTINGYYLISASVWWAAGVSNLSNQTNVQIRQNGSTQKAIVQSPIEWNSGNTQSVTRIIQLNGSTDYLDITAYTGNTTSQVVQAGSSNGSGTWFSAALQ
jgi:hypothetical protein